MMQETFRCDEFASVVGSKPADVREAAGKHLVVDIEAATNHVVLASAPFRRYRRPPSCRDFLPIAPGLSDWRLICDRVLGKSTAGIGVVVSRTPVAVPKSAGSIYAQVIDEESGPDGEVCSYRPQSGPHGLRHRAI